jgi:CheY-like chemotaxis protein
VPRYIIEKVGGIIFIAENGKIALKMLTENKFDIILMEVQMLVMDGHEATRRIRKLPGCSWVPAIEMTVNIFEKDRLICIYAEMNDFITKPLEYRQFLKTVSFWMTSGVNTEGQYPEIPAANSGVKTEDSDVKADTGSNSRQDGRKSKSQNNPGNDL